MVTLTYPGDWESVAPDRASHSRAFEERRRASWAAGRVDHQVSLQYASLAGLTIYHPNGADAGGGSNDRLDHRVTAGSIVSALAGRPAPSTPVWRTSAPAQKMARVGRRRWAPRK